MESVNWQSNKMYYRVSDYGTRDDLLDDMLEQAAYLLSHGNWLTCYPVLGDNNVYVLEFASQDPRVNKHVPVWLTPDEAIAAAEALKPTLEAPTDDSADDGDLFPIEGGKGGGKNAA